MPSGLLRWSMVLVDLDPTQGGAQAGARPCLVVSNDGFNRHSGLVTILPITKRAGKQRQVYAFEVLLPAGAAGNDLESIVMPQQIRTVTRHRVRHVLGRLRDQGLRDEIEDRLIDHLGIGFDGDPEP
ncbi:MAG: type II toxin-antitoxin system PemK/MazF family toxin [Gemmatimonadetes bacterium]|nr:type II toxin-antitoxin system PemK/MazF family toxin [Gemmatimonadota bacterium]